MADQLEAEYTRWCDAFRDGVVHVKELAQETLDLRAEVARLKEANANLLAEDNCETERLKADQFDCLHNKSHRLGIAEGMEEAAKIAKDHIEADAYDQIVPAILAAAKEKA